MDRLLGELEVSADEVPSPGVPLPSPEVPLQNTKKRKNTKEPENGKTKRKKNTARELVCPLKFWTDGLKIQSKPESLH